MKNIIVKNIEEYKEVLENVEEMMKTKFDRPTSKIIAMVEETLEFPLVVSTNWTQTAKGAGIPLSLIRSLVNWSEVREQYIEPWYNKKENIGKLYYFWNYSKASGSFEIFAGYYKRKKYSFFTKNTSWKNACAVQDVTEIGATK